MQSGLWLSRLVLERASEKKFSVQEYHSLSNERLLTTVSANKEPCQTIDRLSDQKHNFLQQDTGSRTESPCTSEL